VQKLYWEVQIRASSVNILESESSIMAKKMYNQGGNVPPLAQVATADLSTARWKQLMRVTSDLVWLADATGEITELNPAWQAYTGQSVASDLSQSFFEVIHPDDQAAAQQLWKQAVLTQALYETTVRLRNGQGIYTPFLLQAQSLEDKNGEVEWLGIAIQQHVITEELSQLNTELEQHVARRTAQLETANFQNKELRLRERESDIAAEAAVTEISTSTERLTLALDAAKMGWWDVDVTTDRAIWNNYHEIIFGYEPGTPERDYFDWERRVHPEDLERIHVATHRARDNHESLAIQYRIIWPDGSVHWVDAFGRFSYDAEGRPVRMLGVLTDITERKKVESDLRASEEFNRNIVENSADCVKVLDNQGRLVSMNAPGKQLMEIEDITPLLGTFWVDWWNEPYRSLAMEAVEVARRGEIGRFQGPSLSFKGNLRWWDVLVAGVYDSEGQLTRLVGTSRDITESKQTELALRESEEKVRLATMAAELGMWFWDLPTNDLVWTDKCKALFGLSPDIEMSYELLINCLHHDDRQRMHVAVTRALDEKVEYDIEYRSVWSDGTVHWIAAKGRSFYDAEGRAVQMIGTAQDISERKRAEFELREREEGLRLIFEQAAVGVATLDLEGRWLKVNQSLCDIVGYTAEELLSTTFKDITYVEDLERDIYLAQQLLAGEIGHFSREKRYVRKDGQLVWANITVSLMRQSNQMETEFTSMGNTYAVPGGVGQPQYFIAMVEDISERKQAESMLQQRSQELESMNNSLFKASTLLAERNQELDRFVHIVSHDLKAPLRGIANLAGWLEDDLSEQLPEENRSQLQLMRQRVDRMDRLISGLLEFARVGRTNVVTEVVDVPELLTEILDSLTIPSTFTVETECQVSTLVARRILLSQVLMNLISNAFKYHNRPDGILCIGVRDLGKHYEFWVQDDGPGIPAEAHTRIFEIFQTLKPSSSTESTGIGLSIVKKIVEVEGGTIHLESEVGAGSTFRFTWPKQTALAIN
jgi:PAS domain S-box-containing protein